MKANKYFWIGAGLVLILLIGGDFFTYRNTAGVGYLPEQNKKIEQKIDDLIGKFDSLETIKKPISDSIYVGVNDLKNLDRNIKDLKSKITVITPVDYTEISMDSLIILLNEYY